MARIKTNKDIPAPPGGSGSMRGPARISTPTTPSYEQKMINKRAAAKVEYQQKVRNENAKYLAHKKQDKAHLKKIGVKYIGLTLGQRTAKNNAKAQNPGRAQPKGTPPRTGPGSGSGGQSARYNRLTGGLMKHGR